MSAAQAPAGLEVPARVIPVPKWVSPEAQAYLARGPLQIPPNPALDDLDGWGHRIAFIDQMVLKMEAERGDLAPPGFPLGEVSIGDAAVYTVTPPDLSPGEDRVDLDIHGGAFIVGGGEVCRAMAVRTAAQLSVRVCRSTTGCRPTTPVRRRGRLPRCLPGRAARPPARGCRRGGRPRGRQPGRRPDPSG